MSELDHPIHQQFSDEELRAIVEEAAGLVKAETAERPQQPQHSDEYVSAEEWAEKAGAK